VLALSVGSLSPGVVHKLQSLEVDMVHLSSLATEHFQSFGLEAQPGQHILDLFMGRIWEQKTPQPSDDSYDGYIKGLDDALAAARVHPHMVVVALDVSAPQEAFQSVAVALLFQGRVTTAL